MAINAASKSTLTSWDKRKHQEWSDWQRKIACAHSKSPVARLIEKGISRIGKPLRISIRQLKTLANWKFINLKRM
jgi:biopolymer transport protein ExbB